MIEYPPEINTEPSEPGPRETMWLHRRDVFRRASIVAIALLLIVSVGTSTVGVVLIRNQQVQNVSTLQSAHNAARDAAKTAKTIESCTTPGMRCFDRAQRRTGNAVASINQIIVLTASCAVGQTGTEPQIEHAIETCVHARLSVVHHLSR